MQEIILIFNFFQYVENCLACFFDLNKNKIKIVGLKRIDPLQIN